LAWFRADGGQAVAKRLRELDTASDEMQVWQELLAQRVLPDDDDY
jgi:hypothetical protein